MTIGRMIMAEQAMCMYGLEDEWVIKFVRDCETLPCDDMNDIALAKRFNLRMEEEWL
jgi:hypothetical protein